MRSASDLDRVKWQKRPASSPVWDPSQGQYPVSQMMATGSNVDVIGSFRHGWTASVWQYAWQGDQHHDQPVRDRSILIRANRCRARGKMSKARTYVLEASILRPIVWARHETESFDARESGVVVGRWLFSTRRAIFGVTSPLPPIK